ncbi:MAG: DNA polymerase III subunit delta' [Pseudomonadota bacterium]
MSERYPWHEQAWQSVEEQVSQSRLPHALLLQGPSGVGKLDFARQLARGMLCQKAPGAEACGQCHDCHLCDIGGHPDWHELTFELTKEGKLSREIRVDQVRQLSDSLSLKSHASGGKVAIIHPAHKMNTNAANSLLKTLEEPTEQTLLLMVSDQPSRLLPTLRSRCQNLRFALPDLATAEEWLAGRNPDQDHQALLALAAGAPLLAERAAREGWVDLRQAWFERLLAVARGEVSPVDAAAEFANSDAGPVALLHWAASFCADLLRLGRGLDQVQNRDFAQALAPMAPRRQQSEQALHRWFDELLNTARLAESASLNVQQLLESVLFTWQQLQSPAAGSGRG